MKILCLGDSLTYGYGVSIGFGWVELLEKNSSGITLVNEGVNGDTLQGIWFRVERKASLIDYQYVFVMGGSNDILMGRNFEYCFQKYKEIIALVREKGGKPIVGIPMEMAYDPSNYNDTIKLYHEALLSWAKQEDFPIIDFYSLFREEILCGKNVFDGDVHPNKEGYQSMYLRAKKTISRLS